MGDIKLENGVSGRLCDKDAAGPVVVQIPPGPSVMCEKNAVILASEPIQYNYAPEFVLGENFLMLTAKQNAGEVFLGPERGNAIVALSGDFFVIHRWSLFAFSDMNVARGGLKLEFEPPRNGHVECMDAVSVSGRGIALLSGHGCILKCVLENESKSIVCDSSHLLAFPKNMTRKCITTSGEEFPSYRLQFTGPGVVYLQTKIKQ